MSLTRMYCSDGCSYNTDGQTQLHAFLPSGCSEPDVVVGGGGKEREHCLMLNETTREQEINNAFSLCAD